MSCQQCAHQSGVTPKLSRPFSALTTVFDISLLFCSFVDASVVLVLSRLITNFSNIKIGDSNRRLKANPTTMDNAKSLKK